MWDLFNRAKGGASSASRQSEPEASKRGRSLDEEPPSPFTSPHAAAKAAAEHPNHVTSDRTSSRSTIGGPSRQNLETILRHPVSFRDIVIAPQPSKEHQPMSPTAELDLPAVPSFGNLTDLESVSSMHELSPIKLTCMYRTKLVILMVSELPCVTPCYRHPSDDLSSLRVLQCGLPGRGKTFL